MGTSRREDTTMPSQAQTEGPDAVTRHTRVGGPEVVAASSNVLARTDVARGALDEYEAFAALIEPLDATDWDAPTRCDGFLVRDVAGHVVGLAEDVAKGVPGSRNAEEEAASVRGDSPARVAARLRAALDTIRPLLDALDDGAWNGPSGVPDLTFGRGVLTLWYDAFVHADDIRAALGTASERGAGLAASVEYLAGELTTKGWGPATLALDGVPRYDVGAGGREVTGDALQFLLVATGRADPATMGLESGVSIYE
jgi:uncharacterized protein (TIGR03083 family)